MTLSASSAVNPTERVRYAGFWTGAWRRFRRNILAMYGHARTYRPSYKR